MVTVLNVKIVKESVEKWHCTGNPATNNLLWNQDNIEMYCNSVHGIITVTYHKIDRIRQN